MTSSSACDSRFFFFNEPTSEFNAIEAVEVPTQGPTEEPLLVPTLLLPLSVLDRSPLEWVPPAEDDSPFCALLRQGSSEDSCPCPAPFDCMLLRLLTTLRLNWMADVVWEWVASPKTTPERPVKTVEAPGSPTPSAAEARCFFRGGGDAPPVSESEEEEAEARVSSPRAAVVRIRRSSGWEMKVILPDLRPCCRARSDLSVTVFCWCFSTNSCNSNGVLTLWRNRKFLHYQASG